MLGTSFFGGNGKERKFVWEGGRRIDRYGVEEVVAMLRMTGVGRMIGQWKVKRRK